MRKHRYYHAATSAAVLDVVRAAVVSSVAQFDWIEAVDYFTVEQPLPLQDRCFSQHTSRCQGSFLAWERLTMLVVKLSMNQTFIRSSGEFRFRSHVLRKWLLCGRNQTVIWSREHICTPFCLARLTLYASGDHHSITNHAVTHDSG